MPRLTVPANFISITGSDTLIWEQLNVSVTIGIDILTGAFICTRSGKDTITGIATGENDLEGSSNNGTETGIANSGSLNAGGGKTRSSALLLAATAAIASTPMMPTAVLV